MKKISFLLKSNLFWLVLFLAVQTASSQSTKPFSLDESPLPAPTGFVNDFAGVIDADTKQRIEAQIKAFKERTNPQVEIGVAIVKTTGERPIFEYSLAVARGWKIGSKVDENPGALLFVSIDDRKYFTQISRNLEDELPDGVAGQLNRQYLVPAFKQGNYGKGISDTIDAYIKTIEAKQAGEPVATSEAPANDVTNGVRGGLPFGNCMTCLIILFIILIIIFSRGGGSGGGGGGGFRRRNRWGGGGFGGSALPWIIGGAIGSSGGSSSGWGSSGGSSSGGDSWGGFGGGGDFGGGGAGGDW